MHRNKQEVTTVIALHRSGGRHGDVPIYSNIVIGSVKSKMSVLMFMCLLSKDNAPSEEEELTGII